MTKKISSFINRINNNPDGYLLALLVFLLPFERIPSFDIRGITLRPSLLIAGMIILRTVYLLLTKKIKFNFNLPVKIILFFVLWLILLLPVGINLTRSVSVVVFDIFAVMLALSIATIFKKEYLDLIFKSLLLSSFIVVAFGIYQYFGNILGLKSIYTGIADRYSWEIFGFPRIQSTALEPLYFASYLLLPLSIFISAKLLSIAKEGFLGRHKKLIAFTIYFLSTAIFMTLSRGGISALIILVIATIGFALIAKHFSPRKMILVIVLVFFAFLSSQVIVNYLNKDSINKITGGKKGVAAYGEQIKNIGISDERSAARGKAIAIIKQGGLPRLVFGIGPGQYGPYVQENKKDSFGWTIVNNETLELLVETGVVGLGLFAAFVISLLLAAIRLILKEKDTQKLIWIVGLSAFLIAIVWQYQTFSTLYIVHIWVAIGLLLGITTVVKPPKYSKK